MTKKETQEFIEGLDESQLKDLLKTINKKLLNISFSKLKDNIEQQKQDMNRQEKLTSSGESKLTEIFRRLEAVEKEIKSLSNIVIFSRPNHQCREPKDINDWIRIFF